MRNDLTAGEKAAQIVHAAGESARLADDLPPDTAAVALVAADEATLCVLEDRLISAGIVHKAIRETEGRRAGELLAIGCAPQVRSAVRPLMSSFPLLR